jgi:hypothetical protein
MMQSDFAPTYWLPCPLRMQHILQLLSREVVGVQVVIALLVAHLVFFQLNPNGQLLEVDRRTNAAASGLLRCVCPDAHVFRLKTCALFYIDVARDGCSYRR